jgi:hypothetical protein
MEISTEVSLLDADIDELMEALDYQFRHNREYWLKHIEGIDIWSMSQLLKDLGCPRHIVEALDNWGAEKVVTKADLERWVSQCQRFP